MRREAPAGRERGFALLVVFLMAAVISLYLYTQLPRVAFESERDKEQTLIDRGEQYKRAIQLYVIAVKKYPQKIEDLENTNEKRYLRRRYIDPFTGKDEWRIIHVNAAGVLTDSLVQKPPTPDGKPVPPGGALASATTTTPDPAVDPTTDVNAAVRRRPSDVVGQAYTQPVAVDPNDPRTWAPITITTPTGTANGAPQGLPPSGAVGFNGGIPGQTGLPAPVAGGFQLAGQPGFNPLQNQFKIDANGQLVPMTPTPTGAVVNPQPVPGMPGGTGGNGFSPQGSGINTAGNSLGAQNAATAAINQMLTNPNPVAGGLGTAGGMSTGGIAGVASMYKGPSIKIYKTRQKYQEWEFVFSLNDQKGGVNTGRNPLQPGQNGLTPGQNNGLAPPALGSTLTPPSPPLN